jgi:hypothetical protein
MNVKVSDNVKNLKENVYDWHNRYLEILRKQKEHTIMNVLGNNNQIITGNNNIQKIKSSKKWIYISISIPIISYLFYLILF